jgi:hypothetical protein
MRTLIIFYRSPMPLRSPIGSLSLQLYRSRGSPVRRGSS